MLILVILGASILVVGMTVAFDIIRDEWQHRETQSGKRFEFFYFAMIGSINLYGWVKKHLARRPKPRKHIGTHRRIRHV